MPSNHLILCRPLPLLPSIFPSIRVFSSESVLCIRWPKDWSFSFNVSPSKEYSGLIIHGTREGGQSQLILNASLHPSQTLGWALDRGIVTKKKKKKLSEERDWKGALSLQQGKTGGGGGGQAARVNTAGRGSRGLAPRSEQSGEPYPLSRQKASLSTSPQKGTRAPGPWLRGAKPQEHWDVNSPGNPLPEGTCDGAHVPRLAPTTEGSSFQREAALSSGGSET